MILHLIFAAGLAIGVPAQDDTHLENAIIDIAHKLSRKDAKIHVAAARKAGEKYGYEPEFLLAQAFRESSYRRTSLSYRKCPPGEKCKRTMTYWRHRNRPKYAKTSWYCGVMQVGGYVSWKQCRRLMMDVELNYMTGAKHLKEWETKYISKDRTCKKYKVGTRDARTCALYGYVGGFKSLKYKRSKYPGRIYRTEKKILRLVAASKVKENQRWAKDEKINGILKQWSVPGKSWVACSAPSGTLSWYEQILSQPKQSRGSTLPRK
jgi:hypothetical protein